MLGGYLRILGAPIVQSCCTYHVFVYGRCICWICIDITRFYEEQHHPSRASAWPVCQTPQLIRQPIAGGGRVSTQCVQQFVTAVTAPPIVGCVVWRFPLVVSFHIVNNRNIPILFSIFWFMKIRSSVTALI